MERISSGVIRRIDDLGRIVIPKEHRRHIGVQSDDPIEISLGTDENGKFLVLAPYRPMNKLPKDVMHKICKSISAQMPDNTIIAVIDAGGVVCSAARGWKGDTDMYTVLRDQDLAVCIYRDAESNTSVFSGEKKGSLFYAAAPIRMDLSSGMVEDEKAVAALTIIAVSYEAAAQSQRLLAMGAEIVSAML